MSKKPTKKKARPLWIVKERHCMDKFGSDGGYRVYLQKPKRIDVVYGKDDQDAGKPCGCVRFEGKSAIDGAELCPQMFHAHTGFRLKPGTCKKVLITIEEVK